jgi:hypothetical protein
VDGRDFQLADFCDGEVTIQGVNKIYFAFSKRGDRGDIWKWLVLRYLKGIFRKNGVCALHFLVF